MDPIISAQELKRFPLPPWKAPLYSEPFAQNWTIFSWPVTRERLGPQQGPADQAHENVLYFLIVLKNVALGV